MKRFLSSVAVVVAAALLSVSASAQVNCGVIGGATFSSAKSSEWKKTKETQYHVGATFKFPLPLGFALQPSLMYQVKGVNVPAAGEIKSFDYRAGYLNLPVSVQWGPDLLIMRPYVEFVPFVGYALNNRYKGDDTSRNDWTGLDRWEYGIGFGAGVEVWHFQVSARYNWNLGTLFDAKKEIADADSFAAKMKSAVGDKSRFRGFTISLAVLF